MAIAARVRRGIELAEVEFICRVTGPSQSERRTGWRVGQNAEAITYYPAAALVVIRVGRKETGHPLALVDHLAAAGSLSGQLEGTR